MLYLGTTTKSIFRLQEPGESHILRFKDHVTGQCPILESILHQMRMRHVTQYENDPVCIINSAGAVPIRLFPGMVNFESGPA